MLANNTLKHGTGKLMNPWLELKQVIIDGYIYKAIKIIVIDKFQASNNVLLSCKLT